ncbi:hypothetical protein GFH30_12450 [Acinetobacter wanghuae]|uniref:RcnB family protein n=1 Tax=Acinetobacter wanghuae TaxID=2662362 RepID=A0A5Q0P7J3_9GAMM|nr:RcnB family protein [Acinetobacter wanghuae]MQW93135.1 hypothetical protein [Acinetobacter wanghuae]QGA12121.1 hypothetical protein GFH30_12450 [Acinetobacter wanghuae]
MNTFLKAIVLSISTALVAAPVMAAPQEHQPNKHYTQQQHKAPMQPQQLHKNPHHKPVAKKAINPSRDWRVGQKVPNQHFSQSYKVDHKQYKKLSKPGRNQQWIKVNGDYILTNVKTHNIIKIIAG